MLTDFITIYENALTTEYCEQWIGYINTLREQGLVLNESVKTYERDHEVINFANDDSFDLRSSDKLSREFLPTIKPCVDQYLQDFSVLGDGNFFMYDVKAKRIPIGGGFHKWHYENAAYHFANRSFVVQAYLNTVENGGETEFYIKIKELMQFKAQF